MKCLVYIILAYNVKNTSISNTILKRVPLHKSKSEKIYNNENMFHFIYTVLKQGVGCFSFWFLRAGMGF